MITEFIMHWFFTAIDSIFSLFPNFDSGSLLSHTDDSPISFISLLSQIVPIAFLFLVFGYIILVEGALFVWDLGLFVYHQFWGSS